MATLTVEASDLDGLEATYNAVAASDVFVNDGKTIIHVVNASGTADTVAIVSTQTVDGLALETDGSVRVALDLAEQLLEILKVLPICAFFCIRVIVP